MSYLWLILIRILRLGAWLDRCITRILKGQPKQRIPRDYFIGLNYLLNQQPDKAVDIFIKLVQVDGDTVDTHLALGHLFRQRGEVDRAIRLHQNLMARPELSDEHKSAALLALAQDYMQAGFLDRAENLLSDLAKHTHSHAVRALQYLLDIYQRERAWQKAIDVAKKLNSLSSDNLSLAIAHFYCELAEQALGRGHNEQAQTLLQQAHSHAKNCARVHLLQGKFAYHKGEYKHALQHYQQLAKYTPDYLPLALKPMQQCYQQLGSLARWQDSLKSWLDSHPQVELCIALSETYASAGDREQALRCLQQYITEHPSLQGLQAWLQLQQRFINQASDTHLVQTVIDQLLEQKNRYVCSECGFTAQTMHWQCPSCQRWSTLHLIGQ